jgi:anti-sigma factor RsiW
MTGRDFSERDIHMALDGELPAEERAAYELWLSANPEMAARSARYAADTEALRAGFASVLDEPVPPRLTRLVFGDSAPGAGRAGSRPGSRWWMAAAAAILLAVGGAAGYVAGTAGIGLKDDAQDQLAEEAIAAHVIYAAEKRHAVDVPASDKDHMETWLSNRIGLKLVTPDLAPEGFHLIGGRLLPAGQNKAAMLLYEDQDGNRLSMFITAEPAASGKGAYAEGSSGPRAIYWLDKGYGCAIVGTLPGRRLNDVASSAYRQLVAGISS